ncbi:MAG: hypothetical protein AMXMBFR56_13920 [Polyangiaceae bacterium]
MASPAPLESIGRYQVVGHLATGGMAEILLGRLRGPSGFERPVVIKRILPHLAEQQRFVDMFLDEARIAAGIQHKNVVQVTDLGHSGQHLYLVMEYLEGENVAALIKRSLAVKRKTSFGLAAYIVAEACSGLHAAHELTDDAGSPLGIVHRDVSPQNVFVTYSGGVKVLDFGVAKAFVRISPETEAGQLKGKVEYMSPEQARGKPLDRRSDIFALGVVLYELVSRRRLFKRDSVLASLEAITKEPILPPSQVAPDCPVSLERVILKALVKDPAGRYATAAEMRRDLLAVTHETLGAADPEQALAGAMQELFRDRATEKREMLRRVRAGEEHPEVPVAEPDESVDIPDLIVPPSGAPLDLGVTPTGPTLASVDRPEALGAPSVPPASPEHYDGSFADLEVMVGEAIARFGMAGDAIVEGGKIRLVGAGPEVSADIAGMTDHWGTLAPELRQRRAAELARRLVTARRAALDGGTSKPRGGVPRFVAPLAIVVVAVLAIGLAFRHLTPGGSWSWGSASPSASAISADQYERERGERAQRVCEATRARIMRGATIGPTEVEGWVVELALARPSADPAADPALGEFLTKNPNGSWRFVWKEAGEIASHEGIGTEVTLAPEPVPLDGSPHGLRLTFAGKYVTPYFYSGERRAFLKLANALTEKLGATHGALYARCALGTTHHLGAWFTGPTPGAAAASLVYWIGAFGDPAQVRESVLFPDGGRDVRASGALGRIADKTKSLDRNKVRAVIGQHEGMITGKADGPTTLTFPFADANRAARASFEVAKVSGVGVER